MSIFRLIFGENFYSEIHTSQEHTLKEFLEVLYGKEWFVSGDKAIHVSQIVTVEKIK